VVKVSNPPPYKALHIYCSVTKPLFHCVGIMDDLAIKRRTCPDLQWYDPS